MSNVEVTNALEHFFSQFHALSYESGHIIQPAYAQSTGIYLLTTGFVKQYILTADGQEVVVNLYKPYSFFPMIPAITGLPNNYFFESLSAVTAYRAPVEETLHFLKNNPEISWDLLTRLYIGIDGLSHQMVYNSVGTVEQKVITALVNLVQRFGERQTTGEIVLTHRFTHRDVSLMTGTSRESVSRVLESLQQQGLLKMAGRKITVLDVRTLKNRLVAG